MTSAAVDERRRAELAGALARLRARIAAACAAAGRDPGELTLVAVTKTHPAADVVRLAGLGVRDIGENRDQEASAKAAEVAAAGAVVRWHFVGQLQRNKCRSVVRYADMVHSVDRVRLAEALAAAAQRHRERPLDVLVQVSLDGDPKRGGAVPDRPAAAGGVAERAATGPVEQDASLGRVAEAVAAAEMLRLRGVMTVAPLGWAPERAFTQLAEVAAEFCVGYPTATLVSAGMSDDFEVAIAHGATHLRIGSALLGTRASLG
ncbi:MAG TPA: alanine racemase [Pseudonocardiaceae bacterium]|nr:alanine racemase [Pseudonocardiaceae bacterium]